MMDELVEGGMRKCGPIYVILAISLILTVTYTYFCILLIEVAPSLIPYFISTGRYLQWSGG